MWVTEVLPATGERADAATPAGRDWLRARYRRDEAAYVRLNMVTSLTGAASGADGTSDTLTSRVDRTILGAIRAEADVVLVGAESVRAEGYIVPKSAHLAVLSRTGDLAGHALDAEAADGRVLLLVPGSADVPSPPPGVELVRVGDAPDVSPAAAVGALRGRGLRRIVCEGGPSVASAFADAGVIDEYCVTVAPAITPASAPFLRVGTAVAARPAGMLVDEAGFSYLRLRAT